MTEINSIDYKVVRPQQKLAVLDREAKQVHILTVTGKNGGKIQFGTAAADPVDVFHARFAEALRKEIETNPEAIVNAPEGVQANGAEDVTGKDEEKVEVTNEPAQKTDEQTNAKAPTKLDQARVIFTEMRAAQKSRKEIIERFMADVGLTKAGGSTYYYNLTKE